MYWLGTGFRRFLEDVLNLCSLIPSVAYRGMSENAPGVLHVVQVVLVWNSPPADPAPERLQQLAALLWQRHSRGSMRDSNSGSGETCGGSAEAPLVHSVWAN